MLFNMYKDNHKIDEFKKNGRYNLAYLDDGRIINASDLGKVECECVRCNKKIEIRYRASLLKKEYICQSCLKSGEGNSFYGKHHTEEKKKEHSEYMIGRFLGEDNYFFGKNHTAETCQHLSDIKKGTRTGKDNPFFKKTHTKENKEKQSIFMKTIGKRTKEEYSAMGIKSVSKRPKKTKIEKKTEEKLKELGYDFKYNFILNGKAQYDFLIDKKIILEVHGDFWHGNPDLYTTFTERQIYKKERDVEKQKLAEENGYRYLIVWESQIKQNNWSILNEI
jgi:G:T-mismatch repair DNA endonuclease (very short patch repair protein)